MNTSFARVQYAQRHAGAERLERAIDTGRQLWRGWDGTHGLAGLLLAAMVATLVVVAEQLMDNWAEGNLLLAWVLLWVIGFAALALLAPAARSAASRLMTALDAWSRKVARNRADERLWELARKDPRIMADLQAARSRQKP